VGLVGGNSPLLNYSDNTAVTIRIHFRNIATWLATRKWYAIAKHALTSSSLEPVSKLGLEIWNAFPNVLVYDLSGKMCLGRINHGDSSLPNA
jgi:hypothetical protein